MTIHHFPAILSFPLSQGLDRQQTCHSLRTYMYVRDFQLLKLSQHLLHGDEL